MQYINKPELSKIVTHKFFSRVTKLIMRDINKRVVTCWFLISSNFLLIGLRDWYSLLFKIGRADKISFDSTVSRSTES
ncbi:uncharacterized protein ASCRUDRAFT_73915 [Ascoidea rubescens DSM 1968]|uniref:Uncharacterized protein n=1 Tax=Ascoidea rubescens DSM 1968 TaxID=1344418 RepID=A0A1D2VRK5_9ASCO|nr:hypothetical protein ASCRUDRAFT_73915 [Ascoidea rubescens DSM 1968]ODV64252.1 hypothetical protein ASCRUDRAFT_73915 [Ascoidea rubescens DSM 1968]